MMSQNRKRSQSPAVRLRMPETMGNLRKSQSIQNISNVQGRRSSRSESPFCGKITPKNNAKNTPKDATGSKMTNTSMVNFSLVASSTIQHINQSTMLKTEEDASACAMYNDYLQAVMRKEYAAKVIRTKDAMLRKQTQLQNQIYKEKQEQLKVLQEDNAKIELLLFLSNNLQVVKDKVSKIQELFDNNDLESINKLLSAFTSVNNMLILEDRKKMTQEDLDELSKEIENCLLVTEKFSDLTNNKELQSLAQSIRTNNSLKQELEEKIPQWEELIRDVGRNQLKKFSDMLALSLD